MSPLLLLTRLRNALLIWICFWMTINAAVLTEVLMNKSKRITIDPEISPLSESRQSYTTRRCTDVHLTAYPLPVFGHLY